MTSHTLDESCLIFPFSRINANAISVLLATLDIHPILQHLDVLLPQQKDNPEELKSELTKYKKIILAVSVYSTQFNQTVNLISRYQSFLKDKDLLIIAGGPHPKGSPRSMLLKGVDIVCMGEGEYVFQEIILNFIQNKDLKNILGIAYLQNQKKLVRTPSAPQVNLDEFPPFSIKHRLIRPIEITRGCAWKCRFCQVRNTGAPIKHRSITQIMKYVTITIDQFAQRRPDIRFISPNALSYGSPDGKKVNLEMIETLLSNIRELIGKEGKIYFGSFPNELRPETISTNSVALLKKYTNVKKLIIGGQSGSNRILQHAYRGHKKEDTVKAVKLLIEAGFNVDVDIIFGLPSEESEDIQQTIRHMEELTQLGATIHSHTFLPLVGTPFASAPPGKIHSNYKMQIATYQQSGKLSGSHIKQERDAQLMAQRRKDDKKTN